jgi:uncharacterized membrane protein YdbT with pleckstrin-like domain
MPKLEEVIQLKTDEEVRVITRRHGVTIVPPLLLALVMIVVPFFFLFPLFGTGPAGIVAFLAVVCAGLIIAVRSFIMWDGDIIIMTNQRIVDVDQRGVFARTVNEITLENIQDFSWSKHTLLDQLLNIGHFKARSASGSLTIEGRFIPKPQELQNVAQNLQKDAISDASIAKTKVMPSSPERAGLLKDVVRRMESLDDRSLRNLAHTLKTADREIAIQKLFGDDAQPAHGLKELSDEEESDQKKDDEREI